MLLDPLHIHKDKARYPLGMISLMDESCNSDFHQEANCKSLEGKVKGKWVIMPLGLLGGLRVFVQVGMRG